MAELNDRLKELRVSQGLTQDQLAKELNITKAAVSNYERGRRKPEYETLELIADFFNVDMDYLYGKSNTLNKSTEKPKKKGVKIPVLGEVAAGVPIEAIEDIIDYEEIDEELAATGEFFALQIKGESMEPRFLEGDVIIVRKQPDVENGEIAVVVVNGYNATVKIVQKRKDGIELIATNPLVYTPTFYTADEVINLPIKILGKVIELRAKF